MNQRRPAHKISDTLRPAPSRSPVAPRVSAWLLSRIYEVFPLRCTRCGKSIQIIACKASVPALAGNVLVAPRPAAFITDADPPSSASGASQSRSAWMPRAYRPWCARSPGKRSTGRLAGGEKGLTYLGEPTCPPPITPRSRTAEDLDQRTGFNPLKSEPRLS